MTQILFAVQAVNYRARAQEQQRLEERVRHQVEDAGGKRAHADAQKHVAELRDGGVREDFLDIDLRQTDGGGEERSGQADDGDRVHADGSVQEQGRRARDHVDTRRDHGGGVDESGHRSGAGHRVRQPDIERDLRGFSGRADQQQQRDGGQDSHARFRGHALRGVKYLREIERSELADDQEHGQRKAEVADAVDDECLVARGGRELLSEIESDQQVAAQSHAFPADEQQQVILRQHQHQHEEHEQVQVREEAVIASFVLHVADGVNMDQRADAGDHHQHDGGEPVDGEIDADVQRCRFESR